MINSFFLVALTMFPKFSEFRLPKTNLSTLCHALLAPKKIKDINVSIRKIEHEKCEFHYDYTVLLDHIHLISTDHFISEKGENEAISQL